MVVAVLGFSTLNGYCIVELDMYGGIYEVILTVCTLISLPAKYDLSDFSFYVDFTANVFT